MEFLTQLNHNVLINFYEVTVADSSLTLLAIFFAKWFPYLVGLFALAYVVLTTKEKKEIPKRLLQIFGPPVVAVICAKLLKIGFHEPRPFVALNFSPLTDEPDRFGSFPSAHATFFAALGFALYSKNTRFGSYFIISALVIGFARIATGVHWPIDIIFGLIFGFFIAYCWEKLSSHIGQ